MYPSMDTTFVSKTTTYLKVGEYLVSEIAMYRTMGDSYVLETTLYQRWLRIIDSHISKTSYRRYLCVVQWKTTSYCTMERQLRIVEKLCIGRWETTSYGDSYVSFNGRQLCIGDSYVLEPTSYRR